MLKGIVYSIESSFMLLVLVYFLLVVSTFSVQENALHKKEFLQIVAVDALSALVENGLFEDLAFSRYNEIRKDLDFVLSLVNPRLVYTFEFDGVVISSGSCGFCARDSRLLANSEGVVKVVVLEVGFE